jgi:hypothetical protein
MEFSCNTESDFEIYKQALDEAGIFYASRSVVGFDGNILYEVATVKSLTIFQVRSINERINELQKGSSPAKE